MKKASNKATKTGKPRIAETDTGRMPNEVCFQFHAEILNLLQSEFDAEELKLQELLEEYQRLYARMDEAFKKIVKSPFTEEIWDEDRARDVAWYGMVEMNNTVLKRHFSPEAENAAKRLKILFKTYGNVPRKGLQAETAAIDNILQELNGAFAPYAALVGIMPFVAELQLRNNECKRLMRERYSEKRAKTDIAMKTAKMDINEHYGVIVEMANSLIVTESSAKYEQFAKAVNLVIEKFEGIRGKKRKAAGKKNEEDT